MSAVALLLVVASAAMHAYWNFLLKRAGGTRAFIALSKASEAVVFAPAFAVAAWHLPEGALAGAWGYVLVGTAFVLATYAALAAAYRHGDLSFAYPVTRGGTLLLLPLFGWLAFGERVGPLGWTAVAAILAGVLVMQLPAFGWRAVRALGTHARGPATLFALLGALVLAGGTIWDKHAVQHASLVAYFYGYTALAGACYLAYAWRADGVPALRAEWAAHGRTAVLVGVLNTTSYGLALVALRSGGSTYVVGLRQLSIALGVLLGARLLGEHVSAPRRAGVALLVAGCLLMAWGR